MNYFLYLSVPFLIRFGSGFFECEIVISFLIFYGKSSFLFKKNISISVLFFEYIKEPYSLCVPLFNFSSLYRHANRFCVPVFNPSYSKRNATNICVPFLIQTNENSHTKGRREILNLSSAFIFITDSMLLQSVDCL